jgi:L-lactate dehydrogenase complex protein LldG
MDNFIQAARNVGADVQVLASPAEVLPYLREQINGPLLVPPSASLERSGIMAALLDSELAVVTADFRTKGASAEAGLTSANFGIAETGTIVLESTAEDLRIATTLPEKHFVLLDPGKILATSEDAVPVLHDVHRQMPQAYLAYITGPSRTADIERVLTIGVHGPAELHILLVDGLSKDLLEH